MSDEHELKKGTTVLLILAVLVEGPRHGYAIAREVERRSQEALRMGEGALYPALRAMEREKLVVGTWEVQPSGPARRVYAITDAGQKKLAKQVDAWRSLVDAVGRVIGAAPHGQPA
jgi:PadR family transcriptional regulator PadR